MMGDVVSLDTGGIRDGIKVDSDQVLEAAVGKLRSVAVVGIEHDGTLFVAASDGAAESHFLFARAGDFLIRNEVARS
jgi:hypothetical protein